LFVKMHKKYNKSNATSKTVLNHIVLGKMKKKTALILIVDAGCTIHKKVFRGATTILLFPISNYVLYVKIRVATYVADHESLLTQ
jgi:hypothetical protein